MANKTGKETESEFGKAERLRAESKRLLDKASEIYNRANESKIDGLLEQRLTPAHYEMIKDLSKKELVLFGINQDYYLIGIEERKTFLTLVRGDQLNGLQHKSLRGARYPIATLVGYYCGFSTMETTGNPGDFVFVNPSLYAPILDEGGMIKVPLETIVGYERLKYYPAYHPANIRRLRRQNKD